MIAVHVTMVTDTYVVLVMVVTGISCPCNHGYWYMDM